MLPPRRARSALILEHLRGAGVGPAGGIADDGNGISSAGSWELVWEVDSWVLQDAADLESRMVRCFADEQPALTW